MHEILLEHIGEIAVFAVAFLMLVLVFAQKDAAGKVPTFIQFMALTSAFVSMMALYFAISAKNDVARSAKFNDMSSVEILSQSNTNLQFLFTVITVFLGLLGFVGYNIFYRDIMARTDLEVEKQIEKRLPVEIEKRLPDIEKSISERIWKELTNESAESDEIIEGTDQ